MEKQEPKLSPGEPKLCAGNPDYCDECDHLMDCVPDWEHPQFHYSKDEEEKALRRLNFLLSK